MKITTDQNTKTWYENDRAGHRQAMSVLASVTGKKGDILVVDDANDAEKVQSQTHRSAINSRWDNAIFDRVIDFKTGRRVVIGQRTHVEDLIGHVLQGREFEELCIPEEFDAGRRATTSIGWTDWRADKEFLRPDQFGQAEKAAAVARLGSIGYETKHNQRPRSQEGARFKRHWFPRYILRGDYLHLERPGMPEGGYSFRWQECERWGTADPAASAKQTADFTVLGAWLRTPRNDLVWWDCDRFQAELPDQLPRLVAFVRKWGLAYVGVEAVASNSGLFHLGQRQPIAVKRLDPLGQDKLVRSTQAQILAEAGRIWLPTPGTRPGFPLDEVEGELYAFTGDEKVDVHDDVIDCLSYACKLFTDGPTASDRAAIPQVLGLR